MRILQLTTDVDIHVETRADGTRVVRQGVIVTEGLSEDEADGGDGDLAWFDKARALHAARVAMAQLDSDERVGAESYMRDRADEAGDPAVLQLAIEHGRAAARARRGTVAN